MLKAEDYKKDGNLHFKNGDFNDAIISYSKAIELNKNVVAYYTNRGKCYIKLQEYDKAIEDAEHAIDIDEKSIKAHFLIGKCLCEIGRKDKNVKKIETAINRFKKALSLCSSQNKNIYENQIEINIRNSKKLKFYIEKYYYEIEAKIKYEELKEKISNDKDLQSEEKNEHLANLDKFFKFEYQEIHSIPNEFYCPSSNILMLNPVITKYGNTYEEIFLKEYQQKYKKDPIEDKVLNFNEIYPNLNMRHAVEDFIENNPWAYNYQENDSIENILIN